MNMKHHPILRPTCLAFAAMLTLSASAMSLRAQEHSPEAAPTAARQQHDVPGTPSGTEKETDARPTAPIDPMWAGIMVIVILGLFVMAAAVGPIMRSEMPEEVPVPHGHDEVVGHEA